MGGILIGKHYPQCEVVEAFCRSCKHMCSSVPTVSNVCKYGVECYPLTR